MFRNVARTVASKFCNMKISDRIIRVRVRDKVKINNIQFGFMEDKGTTDAIFIVRQLWEKYIVKNK